MEWKQSIILIVCACFAVAACSGEADVIAAVEKQHPLDEGSSPYKTIISALQKRPLDERVQYFAAKLKTLDCGVKWGDAKKSAYPFVQDLIAANEFELLDALELKADTDHAYVLWSTVGRMDGAEWEKLLQRYYDRRAEKPDRLLIAAGRLQSSWSELLKIVLNAEKDTVLRHLAARSLCLYADTESLDQLQPVLKDKSELILPSMPMPRKEEDLSLGGAVQKMLDARKQKR